jgi:hypothetical protein
MHISRKVLPVAAAGVLIAGCGSDDQGPSSDEFVVPPAAKPAATHRAAPVPRFVGREYDAARRIARRTGFPLHVNGFPGTPISESRCMSIFSQAPPPGTRRPRGTKVGVTIGSCPREVLRKAREVAGG